MIVVRADGDAITKAAAQLRAGGLVAFPTETVYGLGAVASVESAVRRVFEAKGRPPNHPLIAHVLNVASARDLSSNWTALADALATAFWPGPLTIVVDKGATVSPLVTGGADSVAIRAPSHPVARALIAAVGAPLVAPSANRYQTLSPTCAEHVAVSLGDADVTVLDGGACAGGIESTVVDARGPHAVILRLGGVSPDELRAFDAGLVIASTSAPSDAHRPSPGMDDRHYAPRARLVLMPTRAEAIARAREMGAALVTFGEVTGAISLSDDPARASHDLYATLHAIDASGADEIVVEAPPKTPGWEAILDRLTRASR